MTKKNSTRFEIGIVAGALLVASVLWFAHQNQARSRPADSIVRLFVALGSNDLTAVRTELVPEAYDDFVRAYGAQKFERVRQAYDHAYRLGEPQWLVLRERAHALAARNYDQLQQRVVALGKEAFAALAVDARMKLMDDQALYSEFVFEQGVASLSPEERARIGSVGEFRAGQDRDRFLEHEGFAALSGEDRALSGNAAALGEAPSEAKTALHDKFGLPLLPRELRNEIGSITRADLQDVQAFKLKFGEPVAKKFLQEHRLGAEPQLQSCGYAWSSERGSLLLGDEAVCSIVLPLQGGSQMASLGLVKQGFAWRVAYTAPNLSALSWGLITP